MDPAETPPFPDVEWTNTPGYTFGDLLDAEVFDAGTVIVIPARQGVGQSPPTGDTEELLIGDINRIGGACDDCQLLDRATPVLRFRAITWRTA